MLKKRIVASVLVRDEIVVQSIGFKKYLPIGSLNVAIEYLNSWGIDEIVILDLSASKEGRGPNFELLKEASLCSQTPTTIGGGITSVDDIHQLMNCGADKICINQQAVSNESFVSEASSIFGSQCIVVSIDVLDSSEGYRVYDYLKKKRTEIDPISFAKKMVKLGAGEIFLNSVDNDGKKQGFDVELSKLVSSAVDVPVVTCGGAGDSNHFKEVLVGSAVGGACAGNLFHFTEHAVNTVKSYLAKNDVSVRIDTFANYKGYEFMDDYRIDKKSDNYLEDLLYTKIKKEII